ncbi:hypothetical protein Misp01_29560 [Microtetraspora sp. NBRC 13810]|uniref:hypothetical protein n=1 Tax=Microtetraspora sp. NBRC 13810 TaxID=3030990 RepID=UPI0024A48D84|nr:hypothetical protein [Microtetraspora sp. NBRC 13810]GLW07826.1 hypothetical protein Misp01_29560 [Microtetraspora sp. NBRC 13810]
MRTGWTQHVLTSDEIIRAVEQRSREDADYRRELAHALRRRDELELERLIKNAVLKMLGIPVEVTFEVIREIRRRLRG